MTDCHGCGLHDALRAPDAIERRAFFRTAGAALASLGVIALGAQDAHAMPLFVRALAASRTDRPDEKRYAIPATDGVAIDKDAEVILARVGARVYAFALACPHQNTALRWNAEDREFQCPKHKSHYRPDGAFIEGRATRDMDRLAIRRDGNALVVDVDRLFQQDENPKEWAAAFVVV